MARSHRTVPEDNVLIKDYVDNGLSSGDMAEKYDVARGTVCRHLKRLGITRPLRGRHSRNRKRSGEVIKCGYPVYHMPEHERASGIGYVYKHVLVMEEKIGRTPRSDEIIHHIDIDKTNYNIDNLYLCKDRTEHAKIHNSLLNVSTQLIHDGIIIFSDGEYKLLERNC